MPNRTETLLDVPCKLTIAFHLSYLSFTRRCLLDDCPLRGLIAIAAGSCTHVQYHKAAWHKENFRDILGGSGVHGNPIDVM